MPDLPNPQHTAQLVDELEERIARDAEATSSVPVAGDGSDVQPAVPGVPEPPD